MHRREPKHQVAYQGFYFKPDRIHEHLLEEIGHLCRRTAGMKMTKIQVTRSFFGTYSMHLGASVHGHPVETRKQSLDPFRGISQCLGELESRAVELTKEIRKAEPVPAGTSVAC